MKLCVIITVSQNLFSLYRDQFKFLMEKGVEVTAIAAPGPEHEMLRKLGVRTFEIPMEKKPAPLKDLISLVRLFVHLCRNRYDIVSVSTPKASLLGTLAARLSFHNEIFFTLRGRAYENKSGLEKAIYKKLDKLICSLCSNVFSISHEMREDFIADSLVAPEKIFVIGAGSSNGVDLQKFTPNPKLKSSAREIRRRLGISSDSIVFLYSGRISKDKGTEQLVSAFVGLESTYDCFLIIQGAFDDTDPVSESTLTTIGEASNIFLEPWSFTVEEYFAAANVFVFPSHREGFGNVAIEASAMGLPVIAFDVVGCRESVLDNITGKLVRPFSVEDLRKQLELLSKDGSLRRFYGVNGRRRVENCFGSELIWSELLRRYLKACEESQTL